MRAESWLENHPRPVEDTRRTYGNLSAFKDVTFYSFCLRDGEHIQAEAFVKVSQCPNNRHLAFLTLKVLPTARRQGLATRLLHEVARVMLLEGRTLLMFVTEDAVPASATVAERLGAGRGLEASTNQLEVSALDRNLLRRWQADVPTETFELGFFWPGPFPEEALEAVAELIGVMNTAPKGELTLDDVTVTPAQLR